MPLTLVLAVGADSSLMATQRPAWRSAGYFVTPAGSIREAITHLRNGDFDLVLLFHSIPTESRERLAFLIRSRGMRVPIVSSPTHPAATTALQTRPSATRRNFSCRELASYWPPGLRHIRQRSHAMQDKVLVSGLAGCRFCAGDSPVLRRSLEWHRR